MVQSAIEKRQLPPIFNVRERRNDRKCLDYCASRENCPYAKRLIAAKEKESPESVTDAGDL